MKLPSLNIAAVSISKFENNDLVSKLTSFAAPIGAIAVSCIVLAFVVWPKFTEVLRLRSSNQELLVKVADLEKKALDLESLDRSQLESELGSSEALVPSTKDVFSFVSQIEQAAAFSGVLLSKLDVIPGQVSGNSAAASAAAPVASAATKGDDGTKVQVKISIGGDYQAVLQFLHNLYSIPRTVSVSDVTIGTSAGVEGSVSQLKVALTVDGYWQELPGQLASIETPISKLVPSEEELLRKVRSSSIGGFIVPSVPSGKTDLFAPL